jgi:hypothetical protein
MTHRYISGLDPVEAAGYGTDSIVSDIHPGQHYRPKARIKLASSMPYGTIDNVVGKDGNLQEADESLEASPTYNPISLDGASDYFRSNYIAKMAEYTGRTSISELANKVLDFDRAELSRLVNNYDYGSMPLKDYLSVLQDSKPDTKAKYERDIASTIFDPIVRRVFREAISEGYFGLKDTTDRFKDIYTNSLAEEVGITYAAQLLEVSERTVKNRMESYRADPRNSLRFPDDIRPKDLEDITEAGGKNVNQSSTEEQARREAEQWIEQQATSKVFLN